METIDAYLERLASAEPTPGGGSAAAIVGALGAALLAMVARITLGSPKHADRHGAAAEVADEADALRYAFMHAAAVDEDVFRAVMAAQKLPRSTEAERLARTQALQDALTAAAAEPLRVAELALETLRLARRTYDLGNAAITSDVACGGEFALSSLRASAFNVRINHRYMTDRETIEEQAAKLIDLEEAATAQAHDVISAVRAAIVSPK